MIRILIVLTSCLHGDLIGQERTAHDARSLDEKFIEFLREHGIAEPADKSILSKFLEREVPEFAALPAIRELRDQLTLQKVPPRAPYHDSGGADPFTHLKEQYGEDIRQGRLGPGRLVRLDYKLYAKCAARLKDMEPPKSMTEYFQELADEGKAGSPYKRRVRACAAILGTDEERAKAFFHGIYRGRASLPNDEQVPVR
ncbi:MAG: hypothetical protein WDN01_16890 [Rhizomicrobium sp.]